MLVVTVSRIVIVTYGQGSFPYAIILSYQNKLHITTVASACLQKGNHMISFLKTSLREVILVID